MLKRMVAVASVGINYNGLFCNSILRMNDDVANKNKHRMLMFRVEKSLLLRSIREVLYCQS